MKKEDLILRTRQFGLRVIKLVDALPNKISSRVIANQLVKSGTSIGANYRAACRGRSKAEFISKLNVVMEEADECVHWLEVIVESGLLTKKQVNELYKEANELTAIFCATLKTTKQNLKSKI